MLIAKNIAIASSPGPLLGSVLGVGLGLVEGEDEDGFGVVVALLLLLGLGAVKPLLLLGLGAGGGVAEVDGALSAGLGEVVVPWFVPSGAIVVGAGPELLETL
jgi:hypothetical protein